MRPAPFQNFTMWDATVTILATMTGRNQPLGPLGPIGLLYIALYSYIVSKTTLVGDDVSHPLSLNGGFASDPKWWSLGSGFPTLALSTVTCRCHTGQISSANMARTKGSLLEIQHREMVGHGCCVVCWLADYHWLPIKNCVVCFP